MGDAFDDAKLRWDELPEDLRASLAQKIAGLYGHADARDAFAVLDADKQQAALIFARRLSDLNLWEEIESITNVYGLGGVGMDFRAHPDLSATLAEHPEFSSRFAAHDDTAEGFYEIGRSRAVLHFLRMRSVAPLWAVHFDLYAPTATPLSALRHLWREKVRGETPDWRTIKAMLA
ncbi:MAG TPA: hypothetical protein VER76_10675 [Pyrinomonadaceae bacterium]|nr:hypothetical protein [Pyrinomonadaceae bacterium]